MKQVKAIIRPFKLLVIQKHSHTGNTGDGKIFVVHVEEVVKIRTNERGRDAL
jgi:nitrogen regulatory protein P-II 1